MANTIKIMKLNVKNGIESPLMTKMAYCLCHMTTLKTKLFVCLMVGLARSVHIWLFYNYFNNWSYNTIYGLCDKSFEN